MIASVSGSTSTVVLVCAVFLAAAVEMVEALTMWWPSVTRADGVRPSRARASHSSPSRRWWPSRSGPRAHSSTSPTLRLVVGLLPFGLRHVVVAQGHSCDRRATSACTTRRTAHPTGRRWPHYVRKGKPVGRDNVAFVVAFKGGSLSRAPRSWLLSSPWAHP